ncbi:hypothetical protein GPN2_13043 [Streptomyces murinus]
MSSSRAVPSCGRACGAAHGPADAGRGARLGTVFALIAEASTTVTGLYLSLFVQRLTNVAVGGAVLAVSLRRGGSALPEGGFPTARCPRWPSSAADVAANGTYAIAAQHGPVTVAAVLASLYPVVTALAARASSANGCVPSRRPARASPWSAPCCWPPAERLSPTVSSSASRATADSSSSASARSCPGVVPSGIGTGAGVRSGGCQPSSASNAVRPWRERRHHGMVGHRAPHHGTGRDHDVPADPRARQDHRAGADPAAGADLHRLHAGPLPPMGSCGSS